MMRGRKGSTSDECDIDHVEFEEIEVVEGTKRRKKLKKNVLNTYICEVTVLDTINPQSKDYWPFMIKVSEKGLRDLFDGSIIVVSGGNPPKGYESIRWGSMGFIKTASEGIFKRNQIPHEK